LPAEAVGKTLLWLNELANSALGDSRALNSLRGRDGVCGAAICSTVCSVEAEARDREGGG